MIDQHINSEPDPDNPGWVTWKMSIPGLFNDFLGKIIIRPDGDDALIRFTPERRHSNVGGVLHGGSMLGFIDISLFAAMEILCDASPGYSVTVDLQTQFMAAGKIDVPVEARVSISKETFSLLFMRGIVEQEGQPSSTFTALVKKARPPKING